MALAKQQGPRQIRAAVGVRANPTEAARTEMGIGSLMPWAGRLWFHTYPAGNGASPTGGGLFYLDENDTPVLERPNNFTDVGRYVHVETDQAFIGRYAIAEDATITPITGFSTAERIVGYARDPLVPGTKLYALSMEGGLWSVDVGTKVATVVQTPAQTKAALGNPAQEHYKAIWGKGTGTNARVLVVSNPNDPNGRFASWNPNNSTWADKEPEHKGSWINVHGSYMEKQHSFATGYDGLSGVLRVIGSGNTESANYRLPLSSWQWAHYFQQEWMRLRTVEAERFLLDLHGTFFELSPFLGNADNAATDFPRMSALALHGRTIPDFCVWNGRLVLAGNNSSEQTGQFPDAGQSQGSLLFTTYDDLRSFGKPTGFGFFWKYNAFSAGSRSSYMLARGYDRKYLNFVNHTATAVNVEVHAHMTTGAGSFKVATVAVPGGGDLVGYAFPTGFSCDWISLVPVEASTQFTAWVEYS